MRALPLRLLLMLMVLALPATLGAQGVDPARQPTAQVRFVHGVDGAGAVDLYLDGQRIVAALPPGEATGYGLAAAGARPLVVRLTGKDGAVVAQQAIDLKSGMSYTLALGGSAAQPAAFLLMDDTGTSSDGRSSLRLVHLAANLGPVAAAVGEAALTAPLPYGQASVRTALAPETRAARVTLLDSAGRVLSETPEIPFGNGVFYTVFALARAGMVQPLLVSYPLTSGGPPTAPAWVPLGADGVAVRSVAGSAGISPGKGSVGSLPVTGIAPLEVSLPFWLALDGFLLMLVVVVGGWVWRVVHK